MLVQERERAVGSKGADGKSASATCHPTQIDSEDEEMQSGTSDAEEATDLEELWEAEQAIQDQLPLADLPYTVTHDQVPVSNVRPSTHKKRKATVGGKGITVPRSGHSQRVRVQKVEADISELKQTMQSMMAQVMASLNPPAQQVTGRKVYRAMVPFSPQLNAESVQVAKVLGDGACLWHSISAQLTGFQPQQSMPPHQGHELKETLLRLFAENATACAAVLGVSTDTLRGLLEEWRPLAAWADARLLALTSAHYNATIVIVNAADERLDIVSSAPGALASGPCWYMKFASDHYEPATPIEGSIMAGHVSKAVFAPWYARQEGAGGATCEAMANAAVLANPENMNGGQTSSDVSCFSWNMGGWKAHEHILDEWLQKPQKQIGFLQETHLSRDGQQSATRNLEKVGYKCYWSSPAELQRTKNGHLRVGWGNCPGVALVAHQGLNVQMANPRTKSAQQLVQKGRLILARAFIAAVPLLLINMYTPAGKEKVEERREMLQDVFQEICAQASHRYLIGADWNESPISNVLSTQLFSRGAGMPRWIEEDGQPCAYTYKSGEAQTSLDGFLAWPDVMITPTQRVSHQSGSPHSIVSIGMKCDDEVKYPRLQPQVIVRYEGAAEQMMPKERWQTVHESIATQIRQQREKCSNSGQNGCNVEESDRKQMIDTVWGMFYQAMANVIEDHGQVQTRQGIALPCYRMGHSQLESQLAHLRKMTRDESGRQKRIPKQGMQTRAEACTHRNIHRLIALAQGKASEKTAERIRADARTLAITLGLTTCQVEEAIRDPIAAIPCWQKRLERHRRRIQDRIGRRWRRALLDQGRPTPRLYRWLKGSSPTPPLTIEGPGGEAYGAEATFQSLRDFWRGIMQSTTGTEEELQALRLSVPYVPEDSLTADEIHQAISRMNLQAVGGLDGWAPTALRGVTKDMCETLALLYDQISYLGVWPSATSMVRTQLIPKNPEAHFVHEQRPLSILSIWYRVWSRAVLIKMGPEIQRALNPHLRGGIPERAIDDSILNWSLQVEATVHGVGGWEGREENRGQVRGDGSHGLCLVTLDAVKCFDNIDQKQVLLRAMDAGLTRNMTRSLSSFYQSLQRVITFGGFVDIWSFHPTRGVPQGCALSAYLCNILVHSWAERISRYAVPEAYLDDRAIYARTPEQIEAAWKESEEWDAEHGWTLNRAKTHHACIPSKTPLKLQYQDGEEVPKQESVTTLGHQIPFSYAQALALQKKRLRTAIRTCQRLEVMKINPKAAQRIVAGVVLKQFAFGIQAVPITLKQCALLRAAIKRATHLRARRHAWPALAALIQTPENMDPQATAMYVHLLGVMRALRMGEEGRKWWRAHHCCA